MPTTPEPLPPVITESDLSRVMIVYYDRQKRPHRVTASEATDTQFDAWARTRMFVGGYAGPWSMEERAEFCQVLHRVGRLTLRPESSRES